jgi:orotate phosphoribosyltransferase
MSALKEELRDILQQKSVCRGDFTLASGVKSDFYVDAKLTTSDPRAAMLVGRVGWQLIQETSATRKISVNGIGGLTMGADWMAYWNRRVPGKSRGSRSDFQRQEIGKGAWSAETDRRQFLGRGFRGCG